MDVHESNSLNLLQKFYYFAKPLIPKRFRIQLRRILISRQKKKYSHVWPIFEPAAARPVQWPGWPEGKRFALLLTHDVDSAEGNKQVPLVMELDRSLGFTATFFFVPHEYEFPDRHHALLRRNGFEIGVHGLQHDGKLYQSEGRFNKNAVRINHCIEQWQATGFRAPCMHHNLAWHHRLKILYDASTYDTDPFEPQGGGSGTIFPFTVTEPATGHSYVEIPYTLPQDHLLFVLLQEKTIDIWKRKLDWIVSKGGVAHVIVHPDYLNFSDAAAPLEKYSHRLYVKFLEYIKNTYKDQYWSARADDLAGFWQKNMSHYR